MFPLQTQEPVIAYLCKHLGCPKKLFWRTPGGPYNGVEIYRGIFITVFQRQDGAFPFLFSVWKPKNNAVLFAVSHKPTAPNTCEMSVPSWYTTT